MRVSSTGRQRRGAITVMAAAFLVVVSIFLAFSIDFGYIVVTESELQNAADAGAISGARALRHGRASAVAAAKVWASQNKAAGQSVTIADSDVEIGRWDVDTRTFVSLPSDSSEWPNAVQVTCHRSSDRGTALNLFFAPIWGTESANVVVKATAMSPARVGSRFLIDEETIDNDVPSIVSLASSLGRTPDELITARGINAGKKFADNDWEWEDNFLDLPDDVVLHLPTGQAVNYGNNDSGLFDIDHPAFPFDSSNSFEAFLTNDPGISSQLDPLSGVAPVTDGSAFPSFVDIDFVHVSPVFKSDISTLNMIDNIPQVNAQGERRGLLCFKIIGVGIDIDGSGSVLPELIIKTVNPNSVPSENPTPDAGQAITKLIQ